MGANTRDATALSYFAGNKVMYPYGAGNVGIALFHVDMAKVAADLGVVIDGSNADIVQMWDIPYPCHILSCAVKLVKAEGAAATITLGDNDAAAGWLASFDINGTVGATKCTLITDANMLTGGKTYNAADTFDITFGTAADIDLAVFDIAVFLATFKFPDWATVSPDDWH